MEDSQRKTLDETLEDIENFNPPLSAPQKAKILRDEAGEFYPSVDPDDLDDYLSDKNLPTNILVAE